MLSICVVTYNTPELARRCISSIRQTLDEKDYELLILDLGSDDDIPLTKNTQVWRHKPTYFAESYNFLASKAKGEKILFINSDVELKPDCVRLMLKELKGDVGAVGPHLMYPKGSPVEGLVMHAGVFIYRSSNDNQLYFADRGYQKPDIPKYHQTEDVPAVTGACMLVLARAFKAAGGFDEAFKNGREDITLCLNLWNKGWRVRYCGKADATHLQNGTGGTSGKAITSFEFDSYNNEIMWNRLSGMGSTLTKLRNLRP